MKMRYMAAIPLLWLAACQTDSRSEVLATSSDKSQVALRSIQQRVFDTSDRQTTLRTVMGLWRASAGTIRPRMRTTTTA